MNTDARKKWYSRTDVLANIVPLLRARETAFLVPAKLKTGVNDYPVRCIKAHASSYLLRNMTAFSFFERQYNLYHSIYTLNGMPMFSYAPFARKEQQNDFFKRYDEYITGVDFVMDFDGDKEKPVEERIKDAHATTLKVCEVLDSYHVPYCVMFSGSKGFHVEVRDFPPTREWREQTARFERIAVRLVLLANAALSDELKHQDETALREMLADRFSFDSSIYNVTRIWKCPYSYDVSTDCIVMPLDTEELKNFDIEKYRSEQVMKGFYLKMKDAQWKPIGLKTRAGSIENFWTMAQALGV